MNFEFEKDNFIPVTWNEVEIGDTVYLLGKQLGEFRAYGPHKVLSVNKKELVNPRGQSFLQYQEILGKLKVSEE